MERPPRSSRPALSGPSLQVEGAHAEERKLVTVLFADLSGSTALAERLDPEEMRRILAAFFNALAHEILRFGGTVDKYAGDAVMAVFGAPVAHEDDPARALRAAMAMQEAVSRLNETMERDHGIRLALRIGLNSGGVVAGTLPGEVEAAYTVVGDAVNTAQRLQSVAEPGGILVGATTQRLAAHAFAFDAIDSVRVKGKADPVVAFRLVRARAPIAAPLRSVLVGRDAELATLLAAVEAVERGEGRIALITGEAGIGKSRLLAEAKRAFSDRDVTGLEGRALSITQGVSYLPFIEIIRQDAGITEDEPEAASWDRLEGRLRALFIDDVADALPYLATLVGLTVPAQFAERVRYLDPQAMGLQIFASARRYVVRLARERPLVLVFEDWHWADESSAALLGHLLPLVETERLGIFVASRPEEPGTAVARLRETVIRDHGARFIEVRLAPLAALDSGRLLHNLVPIESIPPSIRTLILERTEGNPFFMEEVVRSLIDLGGIVPSDDGEWRATERLESITIPDTVQAVVVARIDRLDDEVKQVLKIASVIGRSFLERVLRAIAEADETLDGALAELEQLDLIRERSRIPELEYVFTHALVHDAAYESLLLQRRRELHARVGEAIERLFAKRLDEFSGVLAYHFARAEKWEQAQNYLFKAGDRAERVAGDAEALAHYRQAVAAYGRAFGDRWDPVQRAKVERRIGEALFRRGELVEALESLDRCLALLDVPVPTTDRSVRVVILEQALRQIGHRALPRIFLRKRHDPAPEEWMRALELRGWILTGIDVGGLIAGALWSLNLSESNDFPLGIAISAAAVGAMCDLIPLRKLAARYHRRAAAIADEIGHPLAIGLTHTVLGLHEWCWRGDGPAADEHYRIATEAYRGAGKTQQWARSAAFWSTLRHVRGDLQGARALAMEIARVGEETGDRYMKVLGWLRIGNDLLDEGNLTGAEEHLVRASDAARAIPDALLLVRGQALLGLCWLRRGNVDAAIAILEDADRIIRQRHIRTLHATTARNGRVEAYLAAAERAGPARWLDKARQASKESFRQARLDRGALPGAYRWRGSYEWSRGHAAAARVWWERSAVEAKAMGLPFELEQTHEERARRESQSS